MGWLRRSRKEASDALREAIGDYELPHFPGATLEAMNALRDADAPLDRVVEALKVDPGLSVRVLTLVNAAAFGLRQQVDDLGHAVQLLGRSSLESLLISLGVRQALPAGGKAEETRAFWHTAACRAVAARRLASLLCPSDSQSAFTAALLQDMAVPLLAERHGDAYAAVLEQWRGGEAPLHELEQEAFGCNHAGVGTLMCQVWGLPESLAAGIGAHHEPPEEAGDVPAPVLLVACLRDPVSEAGIEALVAAAEERHGVERDRAVELLDESLEEAEDLARLLA